MTFFMWMTFLGLALATRCGENIRVTYFIEKLGPKQRLVLELFMHLLVIATMIVILWFSFRIIRLQMRGTPRRGPCRQGGERAAARQVRQGAEGPL